MDVRHSHRDDLFFLLLTRFGAYCFGRHLYL
jgi:hypothetical protein